MDGNGRGGRSPLWSLLLLIPFVAMLWISSYDRAGPSWGGVPFFYEYQLLWIFISAGLTLIVYPIVFGSASFSSR